MLVWSGPKPKLESSSQAMLLFIKESLSSGKLFPISTLRGFCCYYYCLEQGNPWDRENLKEEAWNKSLRSPLCLYKVGLSLQVCLQSKKPVFSWSVQSQIKLSSIQPLHPVFPGQRQASQMCFSFSWSLANPPHVRKNDNCRPQVSTDKIHQAHQI